MCFPKPYCVSIPLPAHVESVSPGSFQHTVHLQYRMYNRTHLERAWSESNPYINDHWEDAYRAEHDPNCFRSEAFLKVERELHTVIPPQPSTDNSFRIDTHCQEDEHKYEENGIDDYDCGPYVIGILEVRYNAWRQFQSWNLRQIWSMREFHHHLCRACAGCSSMKLEQQLAMVLTMKRGCRREMMQR